MAAKVLRLRDRALRELRKYTDQKLPPALTRTCGGGNGRLAQSYCSAVELQRRGGIHIQETAYQVERLCAHLAAYRSVPAPLVLAHALSKKSEAKKIRYTRAAKQAACVGIRCLNVNWTRNTFWLAQKHSGVLAQSLLEYGWRSNAAWGHPIGRSCSAQPHTLWHYAGRTLFQGSRVPSESCTVKRKAQRSIAGALSGALQHPQEEVCACPYLSSQLLRHTGCLWQPCFQQGS